MLKHVLKINRAPVLTLWAAVVAERLGFSRDEALSLGKALAGLNAQTKGRSLGIYHARKDEIPQARRHKHEEEFQIEILGRAIPAQNTNKGLRAVSGGQAIDPENAKRYLGQKFGEDLEAVQEVMTQLAEALDPEDLAREAFSLYEQFRPIIPEGKRGWGAAGELDLEVIRALTPKNDK
jgi:hypothetical protein